MTTAPMTIAGLTIFPLKSARGIPVLSARVGSKGLLDDRSMMVVDETGCAVTARAAPLLMQIRVVLDGDEVILFAPGRPPIGFRREELKPACGPVSVWGSEVSARDAGDAVADWLCGHLERPCRLVLQDDRHPRALDIGSGGVVSLADTAPLLLASTASLEELNLYLEQPVEMDRFRPNVVVAGELPFDEDAWAEIRIGDMRFEVAGACDRCMMTTLDPASGQARQDHEPLSMLGKQRRGEDGKVYFGQFLIPHSAGRIHLGDAVEVLSRRKPVVLLPGSAQKVTRLPMAAAQGLQSGSRQVELTCVAVIDETNDMKTFRFVAEPSFTYSPGQFITLMPVIDGETVRRSYTISSSPSRPLHMSVTVKRAQDGFVSCWLHENLHVGDRLQASGPNGKFHLGAAGDTKKLFLVSAGSGVTPMISILRTIADANLDRDVVYHHSARTAADMPFRDELKLLQHQLGERLRISWNLSAKGADDAVDAPGIVHAGRFDETMAQIVCPDLSERIAFCCGPTGFRNKVRDVCTSLAAQPALAYLEESFGADESAVDLPPIGRYSVSFQRSGKTVEGEGTTTLLALARGAGVKIQSDCEAGICGSCRCTVVTGDWRIAANAADRDRSVLSDEEKAANVVLACSTSPIGDVVIEL